MRKCLNCSARLTNDVTVCPACGSEDISEIIADEPKPVKRKASPAQRLIATVVLLAICLGAVGYIYFAKIVPSGPVKNSVIAIYEGNMEAHINSIPPDVREEERALLNQTYGDAEKFKESAETKLTESLGKNVSVKVKVLETQNLSKEALIKLQEDMKKYISSEIKQAAYITIKITLTGDDSEFVTAKTITSLKINGKWYAQNTLFNLES